jgi:anti-sigma B factor antagonist
VKLADVRLTQEGDATVATIAGEIDMSNAAELERIVASGTPNSAAGLILDLTRLDYIDSAGIHLLFSLYGALRTRAQGLVIVVGSESVVADTFRLAGVEGRIEMAGDLDQALQAIAT